VRRIMVLFTAGGHAYGWLTRACPSSFWNAACFRVADHDIFCKK
jgi:hypothetical protein